MRRPLLRPRRVLAIAHRDLHQVLSGKRWGLAIVASLLLWPLGAVPVAQRNPFAAAPDPDRVVGIRGQAPPALADRLRVQERARAEVLPGPPVVVRTRRISDPLRNILDDLDGEPSVRVAVVRREMALPGRNLMLALVAISVLTAPLANTLPGERTRGTLEPLLSTAVSRLELVAGKWLAWTGFAAGTLFVGAIAGLFTGAQTPGWWMLAAPAAVGMAVALGLFLVRDVHDIVGGATVPMRVLPIAAVGAALVAWALGSVHPLLAAAVPLGGALLVAGDALPGTLPALLGVGSTVAGTGVLLWGTARVLGRVRSVEGGPGGGWALGACFAAIWWIPLMGPEVWGLAGNPDLAPPVGQRLLVAACMAWLLAILVRLRAQRAPPRVRTQPVDWGWAVGLGLGLALLGFGMGQVWPVGLGRLLPHVISLPMGAPSWAFGLVGLFAFLGAEAVFRGPLQRRLGLWLGTGLWTLIVFPAVPGLGLASGLGLGWLARRGGLGPCLLAQVCWWALALALNVGAPGP